MHQNATYATNYVRGTMFSHECRAVCAGALLPETATYLRKCCLVRNVMSCRVYVHPDVRAVRLFSPLFVTMRNFPENMPCTIMFVHFTTTKRETAALTCVCVHSYKCARA